MKINALTLAKVIHVQKSEEMFEDQIFQLNKEDITEDVEVEIVKTATELDLYKDEIKQDIENELCINLNDGFFINTETGQVVKA